MSTGSESSADFRAIAFAYDLAYDRSLSVEQKLSSLAAMATVSIDLIRGISAEFPDIAAKEFCGYSGLPILKTIYPPDDVANENFLKLVRFGEASLIQEKRNAGTVGIDRVILHAVCLIREFQAACIAAEKGFVVSDPLSATAFEVKQPLERLPALVKGTIKDWARPLTRFILLGRAIGRLQQHAFIAGLLNRAKADQAERTKRLCEQLRATFGSDWRNISDEELASRSLHAIKLYSDTKLSIEELESGLGYQAIEEGGRRMVRTRLASILKG